MHNNTLLRQLTATADFDFVDTTTSSENETSSDSDTSMTSSSEDSDDDLILFPLLHYLTTGRRRCRVEDYLQIVDSWNDQEFKEHLRLNRNTALKLIDELQLSGYIPTHSFGVRPISAKLSFILFLWYIANTEPLRTLSDRFDVSISSVFRVLRRVLKWLLTKLNTIIQWPQGDNVEVVCEQFFCKQGISNVLGAIDCTHIRIEKPRVNARDYCNRKKFFSISLQAVVDANMRFTNIYCGEPGSLHDARILRRSPLFHAANSNHNIFPNRTFLLGDSAYAVASWLIPPYKDNGHLTAEQVQFNYMHSSTRMAVERAFGQLKGRFRRIKFFNEYRQLSFVADTVVAACILHNYCINENDENIFEVDLNDDIVDVEEFGNVADVNNVVNGADRRTAIFNELFARN